MGLEAKKKNLTGVSSPERNAPYLLLNFSLMRPNWCWQ